MEFPVSEQWNLFFIFWKTELLQQWSYCIMYRKQSDVCTSTTRKMIWICRLSMLSVKIRIRLIISVLFVAWLILMWCNALSRLQHYSRGEGEKRLLIFGCDHTVISSVMHLCNCFQWIKGFIFVAQQKLLLAVLQIIGRDTQICI